MLKVNQVFVNYSNFDKAVPKTARSRYTTISVTEIKGLQGVQKHDLINMGHCVSSFSQVMENNFAKSLFYNYYYFVINHFFPSYFALSTSRAFLF